MNHILIINPNKDFFTNPTLVYLLKKLQSKKRQRITLVVNDEQSIVPDEFKNLEYFSVSSFRVSWPKKIWKWWPVIISTIKLFLFCRNNNVTKIIAIDPVGLIVAGRIKMMFKEAELHYFSFEIFFKDEVKNDKAFKKIKEKEIFYSSLVDIVVVQDEVRKNLLFQENQFPRNQKCFLIPVAPEKFLSTENIRNIYREKLGIKAHEIILLHSGNFEDWTGAQIIIDLLEKGLPENFRILVHCKLNTGNSLHNRLKDMHKSGYPLVLNESYLPDYNAYLNFISIADFGFAFYSPNYSSPWTGKNIEEIGLASGKFSAYMNVNLPAITTNSKSFRDLNAKYNFGITIRDPEELTEVLQKSMHLKVNKENCLDLYNEMLNPDKFFLPYLQQLTS